MFCLFKESGYTLRLIFSNTMYRSRPEVAIPAWFINILRLRLRLIPSITQFIAYAYITDSILLGGEGTQTL